MIVVLRRENAITDPMVFDTAMREKYPSIVGFGYQFENHFLAMEFTDNIDIAQLLIDTESVDIVEVK